MDITPVVGRVVRGPQHLGPPLSYVSCPTTHPNLDPGMEPIVWGLSPCVEPDVEHIVLGLLSVRRVPTEVTWTSGLILTLQIDGLDTYAWTVSGATVFQLQSSQETPKGLIDSNWGILLMSTWGSSSHPVCLCPCVSFLLLEPGRSRYTRCAENFS